MNGKKRMIEQSQSWLVDAFFDLLKEKAYDSITVKEISEKAQLSRRTFYRLFQDKRALLDFCGEQLIHDYLQQLQVIPKDELTFEKVLIIFFNFWWSKRKPVRLLIKQNLFMNLLNQINPQAFRLYDLFNAPWHIDGSQQEVSYIMSFSVGGFWNLLNNWLSQSDQVAPSPEHVAETLGQALNKIKHQS
ncbi:TetR/AcrR family transcriptional regulator [Lentilactobacillus raoultii]|uniref:TetR/AcrR family transcriptional regulator n=1 Tax=Lentilactobacillus raoultii TaxID=1987503 RepID=A0ABW3PIA7_9LACO|nr:TetR family transcriptional regulator [Lentilactobacillus raoultii]